MFATTKNVLVLFNTFLTCETKYKFATSKNKFSMDKGSKSQDELNANDLRDGEDSVKCNEKAHNSENSGKKPNSQIVQFYNFFFGNFKILDSRRQRHRKRIHSHSSTSYDAMHPRIAQSTTATATPTLFTMEMT